MQVLNNLCNDPVTSPGSPCPWYDLTVNIEITGVYLSCKSR